MKVMEKQKNIIDVDKFINTFLPWSGLDRYSSIFSFKNGESWVTRKEIVSQAWLWKHFIGEKTVSLPRDKKSNIYWLDIDFRNNNVYLTTMMKRLITYVFKGDPFYVEYSPRSKSYHIAFKFDRKCNVKAWKKFPKTLLNRKNFRNSKYVVETIHDNKMLRLPLSKDYWIRGSYDVNSRYGIVREEDKNVILSWFKTPEHGVIKAPFELCHYDTVIKTTRRGVSPIYRIKNYDKKYEDLHYGKGNRREAQIKIAFRAILKNKSFLDFIEDCEYYNNGTSKDMQVSEEQRIGMLSKIWDWAIKHYKKFPALPKGRVEKDQVKENTGKRKTPVKIVLKRFLDYVDKLIEVEFTDLQLKMLYKIIHSNNFYKEKSITFKLNIIYMIRLYVIFKKIGIYVNEVIELKHINPRFENFNKAFSCGNDLTVLIGQKYIIRGIKTRIDYLMQTGLIERVRDRYGKTHSYFNIRFTYHYKVYPIEKIYYSLGFVDSDCEGVEKMKGFLKNEDIFF